MRVITITGVPGQQPINGKIGDFFRKIGSGIKTAVQTTVQADKIVAFAIPRGAFLALVKINFRGLATRLKAARTLNVAKVKTFWSGKWGGNYQKLSWAIDTGSAKKPLFIKPEKLNQKLSDIDPSVSPVEGINDTIGADPVTISVILASAAAVITSASELFNSLGVGEMKDQSETQITPGETMPGQNAGNGINTNKILLGLGILLGAGYLLKNN